MPDYPNITTGLGKLTPQLWARMMKMLRSYESTYPRDERLDRSGGRGGSAFIAELQTAYCADVNRYVYSWVEMAVNIGGDEVEGYDGLTTELEGGRTSEVDGDVFAKGAINLVEIPNTAGIAGAGTSLLVPPSGTYPVGFHLLAYGGGYAGAGESFSLSCTPNVVMHEISGSGISGGTSPQYVFSQTNENDGDCAE